MNNFKWGRSSKARLKSCHPELKRLMDEVLSISEEDVSILCGYRNEERQNAAVREKRSKVSFPNSMHNSHPSRAVDIAPYPIDWKDLDRFHALADLVLDTSEKLGIKVRWGGDWDMDGDTEDQTFNDLPHFELL